MKVLVILNSLLAITLADYAPIAHHYPINIPVIDKTGVPVESPEIVHARHAHLSHVAAVKSLQGSHGGYYGGDYSGAASSYGGGYSSGAYGGSHGGGYGGYHGPYAHIVIGPHGVPIDTPEVQHARAQHFAALAKAHHGGYGGHYRKRRSVYGYAQPQIGHNGVPLDTPEVQAAKAAHFAAHQKAGSGFGGYAGGYGHNYEAFTYPKLAHDGQPLETPEVVALKHAHFAAHAKAISGLGAGGFGGHQGGYGSQEGGYGGHQGGYAGGYFAAASHGHGVYHGPIHIPVIGHNGVPVDTPEVQAARHNHLAALAEASAKGGYEEKPYY